MKSAFAPATGSAVLKPALWAVVGLLLFARLEGAAARDTNALEIRAVLVGDKELPFQGRETVNLGPFPDRVVFTFGPGTNAAKSLLRRRYLLEGFETVWHEDGSEMGLTVRFYNQAGDQIGQSTYRVHGESTGWSGSLKTSTLTHRRETLAVPPQAARLLVVISSAGPPDAVGIYVVANLVVTRTSGEQGKVVLLRSPFDAPDTTDTEDPPPGWIHDGTSPSMARTVKIGQEPQTTAFAILDENRSSHGEWHNLLESAPTVAPGDRLVVEWNEMYSIGAGNAFSASYGSLPSGAYKFHVCGLDVMGQATGTEAAVAVFVPPPFWRTPWFWGLFIIAATLLLAGVSRYVVWHRMRRAVQRLEQQRALEQERLRIAHDIHDDLGARVTQISLLSAVAQANPDFPGPARQEFDKVSKMARELVAALYETVWAVNPENDNLDALGNYVCQMVNQMCEPAALRCRFHVSGLPQNVQVSSQTRHNVSMAVKEAVHNIIKHARAREVTIHMAFTEDVLEVTVQDDGQGFSPGEKPGGHGLTNMKRRLEKIGGQCFIERPPGQGARVRMSLVIKSLAKTS